MLAQLQRKPKISCRSFCGWRQEVSRRSQGVRQADWLRSGVEGWMERSEPALPFSKLAANHIEDATFVSLKQAHLVIDRGAPNFRFKIEATF